MPTIDSLFSGVRQQILATTLLAPDRSWYLRELAARIQVTPSSLQRELKNLVEAGILKRLVSGNRTYFQADVTCPIFPELQGLLKKTVGGVQHIRTALAPLENQIDAAFIYGSYANQSELRNNSDIDLFVIGAVTGKQISEALLGLERDLGREISTSVYTLPEFQLKLTAGNHFLTAVMKSGILWIVGSKHVVAITP